jgi:hypothetical protein
MCFVLCAWCFVFPYRLMKNPPFLPALAALCLTLHAEEPAKIAIDTSQPGWRALTAADFTNVNSAEDTWTWRGDGVLACTGEPVSVMRTTKELKNFELVVEWMHQKPAGNSGVFVWATPESIDKLTKAGKPGLPSGIEVQVLDNAFTKHMADAGKKTDWFTTHGDVFPVGVKMTPIGKTSPDGSRSFPRNDLCKDHGNWNHYYIRAINGEVRLWVNGVEVSGGTDCDPATGYLCLESEGSPILFRHLHIRELP